MATKKSQYRLRGYVMEGGIIELVFGNDPAPEGGLLEFDQDVVETVVTTPHIEEPIEAHPV